MKLINQKNLQRILRVAGLLILVATVSCATNKYNTSAIKLDTNTKINELSLCLNYNEKIPAEVKSKFNISTAEFISEFNKENHRFNLSNCKDSVSTALKINIQKTELVSVEHKLWATLANVIGLGALPVFMIGSGASFYLAFYYFPKDISHMQFILSDDLISKKIVYDRFVINSGYLRSTKKQINRQGKLFKKSIKREIKRIEKQVN